MDSSGHLMTYGGMVSRCSRWRASEVEMQSVALIRHWVIDEDGNGPDLEETEVWKTHYGVPLSTLARCGWR